MKSPTPESESRIRNFLSWKLPNAGLVAGLMSVAAVYTGHFEGVVSSLAATSLCTLFQSNAGPSDPNRIARDMEMEETVELLGRALAENDLDWRVMEALGRFDRELADDVWEAYTRDVDELKTMAEKMSAGYESLYRLLTTPRFDIAFLPSQLIKYLPGFMPHQLIERPELAPLQNELFDGGLRRVTIMARSLSGKSFLAVQTGMAWLRRPGHSVVMLTMRPGASDFTSLQALDPENTLVIVDPHYLPHGPLSDDEMANLVPLKLRVLICQRVGQTRFVDQENALRSYLSGPGGGTFRPWDTSGPPRGGNVILSLGPLPEELIEPLLGRTLSAIDSQNRLTLTVDGALAVYRHLLAPAGKGETSLLGLAKAFLMYAQRQAGGNPLRLDAHTVEALFHELGQDVSQGMADDEEKKIIESLFSKQVSPEEENVLMVMALWNHFSQIDVVPRLALFAGYQCHMNGRDLTKDDRGLLTSLQQARVLLYDSKNDMFRVWHPLQLEILSNEPGYSEQLDWLHKSLVRLKDVAFNSDERKTKKKEQATVLGNFCAALANSYNRLYPLVDMMYTILGIHREAGHHDREAMTANNLGAVLCYLGEYKKARGLYDEALKIRRAQAEKNPDKYLTEVATLANNMGLLLSDMGEQVDARSLLLEALEIRRGLAKNNQKAYQPDLAVTLNNLGLVHTRLREYPDARTFCEESLSISQTLAKENPQVYLVDLASAASNLGIMLRNINEWKSAESFLEMAFKAYTHLAEIHPNAYEPYVALSAHNLGNIMMNVGELDKARELYNKSLTIRRVLANKNPEAFRKDVSDTANNFGVLLNRMGEISKAKGLLEEALAIRRELSKENPKAYLQYVAETAANLGILLHEWGELSNARVLSEEALTIRRSLAGEAPHVFRKYVADSANNLANLLSDLGEFTSSRMLLDEALEIYRVLAQNQPNAYRLNVAIMASNLADLLGSLGEHESARTLYEEALEIFRDSLSDQPRTHLSHIARTANNLGNLLKGLDERDKARALLEEALEIRRSLAAEYHQAYIADVAGSANNLGLLLSDFDEDKEAQDLLYEALKIYRDLSEEQVQANLPNMAGTILNMAVHLIKMGDLAAAAPLVIEAAGMHAMLGPTAPQVFEPRLGFSLGAAKKLYNSPEFKNERDSWLERLREELRRHMSPEAVPELLLFVTKEGD